MDYQQILEKIERFKIPIALSLVGIVLILGGMLFSPKNSTPKEYPKGSIMESESYIQVDVSGAVNNPGVHKLTSGARVEEAIAAAGGLSGYADQNFISKSLNRSQKISDGIKIYIPFEGDQVPVGVGQGGIVAGVTSNTGAKININTATQGELESLPGIGPVTASKIISGRPYQSLDELVAKKIVGKAVYEKIKDLVVY